MKTLVGPSRGLFRDCENRCGTDGSFYSTTLECLTFAAPLPLPEGLAVVPPGGGGLQQQEEGGGGQGGEQHGDQGPGDHCTASLG